MGARRSPPTSCALPTVSVRQRAGSSEISSVLGSCTVLAADQKVAVGRSSYLIIDRETKECACVDAAWDTTGLMRVCQALELNLVAALYTHRHVDHVGGIYQEGIRIEGLSNLALAGVPALMGRADVEPTVKACMLGTMSPQIIALDDGDVIPIGGIKVKAMVTPGHTSGSVCFACGGDVEDEANIEVIITGDTLFVGAFGNLENQEAAPQEMCLLCRPFLLSTDQFSIEIPYYFDC